MALEVRQLPDVAVWNRIRLVVAGVGFALPCVWFGAVILLYAWCPGFRASRMVFWLVMILAPVLTAAATLTAPCAWHRRLFGTALLWVLLGLQVAFLLGRAYFSMDVGTRQKPIKPTAAWMSPLESEWCLQSPGKDYSVRPVSDVRRREENSLRFELRRGECFADLFGKTSFRSEVNARDFAAFGATNWYEFSLFLPADFPIENNRLVLAQWHGADKKYLGEAARSPALAFRYSGGRLRITICHSPDRIVRRPSSVPLQTLFESDQFALGTWHDFVVQAKWSCQHDGCVNVWWNGRQVVSYSGPVGYNDDFGPYFKFGIYRDDAERSYIAYFSRVKVGKRAEARPVTRQ